MSKTNTKKLAAKRFFKVMYAAVFALSAALTTLVLTTCNTPFGFGDAIDWEPPVLTLEPRPSNPFYVGRGAILSGKVTDNIGVDRVILRRAGETEELFQATITSDGRWEISLAFDESQNGETIMVEIVAFDRMGNSDERSIAAVTLIIDIRAPVIEDIWIQRTDTRAAYLDKYLNLKELEIEDRLGEKSDYADKYQNGWFTIKAQAVEDETRIEIISLDIYGINNGEEHFLKSLTRVSGTSAYSPNFLVKEEELLAAGESKWPGYTDAYYNGGTGDNAGKGERYYYKVVVVAIDKGKNEGSLFREDEGYFCMWQYGDVPKGALDPVVQRVVTRGATFPVTFFDDDILKLGFTGVFSIEQWNGEEDIGPSSLKIQGSSKNEKIEWLKEQLIDSTTGEPTNADIYDWNYHKHIQNPMPAATKITNWITGDSTKEKIVYLQTGNSDNDYGDYVLFSITADRKLAPHDDPSNPKDKDTLKDRWDAQSWEVTVVDENKPLIVFDTVITNPTDGSAYDADKHLGGPIKENWPAARTGDSPEESTFPELVNQEFFDINGYTLRASRQEQIDPNTVKIFRMAWIPYGMPGGADDYVIAVQKALASDNYNSFKNSYLPVTDGKNLEGIQHWDFTPYVLTSSEQSQAGQAQLDAIRKGRLITGTPEMVENDVFVKQVFRKKFSILGGTDDIKDGSGGTQTYKNFTYLDNLENEQKLFVFYALDSMGHPVYRQMRLLPNKRPPELTVYDLSSVVSDSALSGGIPNINTGYNGETTPAYYTALNDYNAQPGVYGPLQTTGAASASNGENKSIPFQIYTTNTTLKLFVKADRSGGLALSSIKMADITSGTEVPVGYKGAGNEITLAELYPDETTREFQFEAEDTLGNKAQIKRIISVTNTARLENITTKTESSTTEPSTYYGIGKKIVLLAKFSASVIVTGRPGLNIRYPVVAGTPGRQSDGYVYTTILCDTTDEEGASYLNSTSEIRFTFTVPEGASGKLETMYDGNGSYLTGDNARPILMGNGVTIRDVIRNRPAFVPGYTVDTTFHPNWTTVNGSLQDKKNIYLDGIRPKISAVAIGGKAAGYKDADNNTHDTDDYYFKADETLTLTFTSASKNIKPSANPPPTLSYQIRQNPNGGDGGGNLQGPYMTQFKYLRQDSDTTLVFALNISDVSSDGQLVNVKIGNGEIQDSVDNAVLAGDLSDILTVFLNGKRIFIKKTRPIAPGSTIGGYTFSATKREFIVAPTLVVAEPTHLNETVRAWEHIKEYSLNGGLDWEIYPNARNDWSSSDGNNVLLINRGTWQLKTRYRDRAGNEGAHALSDTQSQEIQIEFEFPKLIRISTQEARGWYKAGDTLHFVLDFDGDVRINTPSGTQQVSITLKDRSTSTAAEATIDLGATATTPLARSITLTWSGISNKEMRNGLYVSAVDLSGLRDRFGNSGKTGTAAFASGAPNAISMVANRDVPYTCPNLTDGIRVDAIAPGIETYSPAKDGVSAYPASATDKRNVITLTFSEPVMKGMGTITIKPKTDFLIPPVFEDGGYYLDQFGGVDQNNSNEVKVNARSNKTTWVDGFYDIYNNSALSAADRNSLTSSTTVLSQTASPSSGVPSNLQDTSTPSMTRLQLDSRTGQPRGPYVKTTHGLVPGEGYSGNETVVQLNSGGTVNVANVDTPNSNYGDTRGPNTNGGTTNQMIPDTNTKWVLAYQYSIHNDNTSREVPNRTANGYDRGTTHDTAAVGNIRNVLKKVKFRWQEIDIVTSNVVVSNSGLGNTVTITLNEPLLRGLEWELSYPATAFTDEAGNPAVALNTAYTTSGSTGRNADYTFWSNGAQKPVIRVNRKSYDARNASWHSPTNANNTSGYTYNNPVANSGWSFDDFKTIDYRIETETPGATISYNVTTPRKSSRTTNGGGPYDAIVAELSGDFTNPTQKGSYSTLSWTANISTELKQVFWALPNLLRRAGSSDTSGLGGEQRLRNYLNGDLQRSSGAVRLFRSYNADAAPAALSGLVLTAGTSGQGWYKGIQTFEELEAGKRYIAATANRGNGDSNRGYEGIFRTVIVLNNLRGTYVNERYTTADRATVDKASRNRVVVEGSNIKSGTPSIPGFPVQDRAETGDSRFVKMMYNYSGRVNFSWISSEIVSEWYFYYFGNGGNVMRSGQVNNFLMVGYGDLTYAYRMDHFPDPTTQANGGTAQYNNNSSTLDGWTDNTD